MTTAIWSPSFSGEIGVSEEELKKLFNGKVPEATTAFVCHECNMILAEGWWKDMDATMEALTFISTKHICDTPGPHDRGWLAPETCKDGLRYIFAQHGVADGWETGAALKAYWTSKGL